MSATSRFSGFGLGVVGLVVFSLGLAGCDSRAKASDPAKPERLSKELETCDATGACEGDLRCFDQVCQRTTRSAVGDYYAALGQTLRGKGDMDGAVAAYTEALGHYDAEKIKLPSEIDCAYGTTLALARTKKEYAERGAKVLHRCILAVPVGSKLRDQAMLDLATLAESGLDPLALGKNQLTDVYLTKGPSKPSTDKVALTLTASPALPDKVGPALTAKLEEQKAALITCWQTFTDTSKKDALVVTVTVKSTYFKSEYEDEAGGFSLKVEPAAGLSGPEAGGDACVRPIVEAAVKASPRDAFTSKVTVTLK